MPHFVFYLELAANQGKTGSRPGLPGQASDAIALLTNSSSQGPATVQQQQQHQHQYRNDRRKYKQVHHVNNMGSEIEVGGTRDPFKSPIKDFLINVSAKKSLRKIGKEGRSRFC